MCFSIYRLLIQSVREKFGGLSANSKEVKACGVFRAFTMNEEVFYIVDLILCVV